MTALTKRLTLTGLLAGLLFAARPAQALPVYWVLQDVTFTGPRTATGHFIYNPVTDTYSDVSILLSGGGDPDVLFDLARIVSNLSFLELLPSGLGPDYSNDPELLLNFNPKLTAAGGTVLLNTGSSFLTICPNTPNCTGGSPVYAQNTGGSVMATDPPGPAPEPATWCLLGLGLLSLAGIRTNVARAPGSPRPAKEMDSSRRLSS